MTTTTCWTLERPSLFPDLAKAGDATATIASPPPTVHFQYDDMETSLSSYVGLKLRRTLSTSFTSGNEMNAGRARRLRSCRLEQTFCGRLSIRPAAVRLEPKEEMTD